jgi:hypothetical protein
MGNTRAIHLARAIAFEERLRRWTANRTAARCFARRMSARGPSHDADVRAAKQHDDPARERFLALIARRPVCGGDGLLADSSQYSPWQQAISVRKSSREFSKTHPWMLWGRAYEARGSSAFGPMRHASYVQTILSLPPR